MANDTMKVTLTLRKSTAERLRRTCHARGEMASDLIDRWIVAGHDEKGEPITRKTPRNPLRDLIDPLGGMFSQR